MSLLTQMDSEKTASTNHDSYNLIVIGGGLGGLSSATLFAKEGLKVCLLDKNKQIGGNFLTFSRDKVIFDFGVHYAGNLLPSQTLHQLFSYLGIMDKLKLHKLDDDVFDGIMLGDDPKIYKHAQGYDRYIASLVSDFPKEEDAIRKYCRTIQEICNKFSLYNLSTVTKTEKKSVLDIDAKGFVDSLTNNVRLRNVLMGSNLLYAGVAHKSPLYAHALIVNSYIESSFRFIGGGSQIARLLVKQIRNYGGIIKTRVKIVKLVEYNGRIKYAEDELGRHYYGKYFTSNLHPKQTLKLTDSLMIRKSFRTRINSIQNTTSCFGLNIVLKKNTFIYRNSNYYFFQNNEIWEAVEANPKKWPLAFGVSYNSPKSRDNIYTDGISILTYMSIEEVSPWINTYNTSIVNESRGKDYEEFKKYKAELLILKADKYFPGLGGAIKSYYCYNTLTFTDYMGTDNGSVVVIEKTTETTALHIVSNNSIISTNHFESDELKNTELNLDHIRTKSSIKRTKRVHQLIDYMKQLTPKLTAEILRCRKGIDGKSIGLGNEISINQLISYHSIIFEPYKLKFWISTSPWQIGKYVCYDLNKIFSEPLLSDNEIILQDESIDADSFLKTQQYQDYLKFFPYQFPYLNNRTYDSNSLVKWNNNFYLAYLLAGDQEMQTKKYCNALQYYQIGLTKNIARKQEKDYMKSKLEKCKTYCR